MNTLSCKRILLVEDEFLVAAMAEDKLVELGAIVVGPAYRVREGLSLAQSEVIDAAVLDVNINGESSDPIAVSLKGRGIPFVLATGYGRTGVKETHGAPILEKPYTDDELIAALIGILDSCQ